MTWYLSCPRPCNLEPVLIKQFWVQSLGHPEAMPIDQSEGQPSGQSILSLSAVWKCKRNQERHYFYKKFYLSVVTSLVCAELVSIILTWVPIFTIRTRYYVISSWWTIIDGKQALFKNQLSIVKNQLEKNGVVINPGKRFL